MLDCGILHVYYYDGTSLAIPKMSHQRLMNLTVDLVTSAKDLIIARSATDAKVIQFSHLRSEKSLYGDKAFNHNCQLVKIEVDPHSTMDQVLAILDADRDLFLLNLPVGINKVRALIKIGNNQFRSL